MTEQEEFEFRARLEAEQASTRPESPTSFSGSMSEINKGLGRGAVALPISAAKGLAGSVPDRDIAGIPMRIQPNEDVAAFRERVLAGLKADPKNKTEQMLGTGAELLSSMAPFAGGPGKLAEKAVGLTLPVLGGVQGEQLAGEQGKMIGSLGAPIAANLLGRVLSPNISPELQKLVDQGVQLTPGQQTGGFLKKFEDYPLVRELTGPAKARGEFSFMEGATNAALKPLGVKIKNAKDGFDAYEQASAKASQAYDDVLPKLNFRWDASLHNERKLQQSSLSKDSREYMEDFFKSKVRPHIDPKTGAIDPAQMKRIDSELGKLSRDAMRDPSMEKRELTEALTNFQGMLRDAVSKQNPNQSAALNAANAAWNNLVRIGDAVVRASGTNGTFTPRQLQESVKKLDSTLRKQSFMRGESPMQDISRAGVEVMAPTGTPNVPYSALSKVVGLGLGGGAAVGAGMAAPTIAAPLIGGAATFGSMYTPWGQRLIQGTLTGQRPQFIRSFGDAMRNAPPLGAATIPLFTQGEQ